MGIHVARFKAGDTEQWGWVRQDELLPIPGRYASLAEFLGEGAVRAREVAAAGKGAAIPLSQVELLAPVSAPCNIVCQGQNYRSHMLEVGQDPDAKNFNQFFRKASSALTSARGDIVKPSRTGMLDYEIELGLIIGRPITGPVQVTRERLHEFIAGIVICNDVSARDLQLSEGQWYKAKSFRTFCPVGPYVYLLEPEDSAKLMNLQLVLSVNNEVRQDSNTGEMIFPPEATLTELSGVMDLFPGDLLLTGTPRGVAAGHNATKSPKWVRNLVTRFLSAQELTQLVLKMQARNTAYLKAGDVVRASIFSPDGAIHLGTQENRVVSS
ncbi:fumarylacetoacetate hydrolase family protein [Stigmatella erecta]|uniref:2-keto-4-pentenoate hydratase/2-oxohepta-3-ene-1,7-dioic acid hydratase (Catechol pathway) n=1 Tax=Stigmatella erecta TaxID=83460 RepID=A0A1I0AQI9_9BACT|nr:fumarylacetoacetate hydrolase family protein [Stigmatella erecta]SES95720.1 2-keto-4-pentenoate hydratase/2-oxohepta-3-ene-1,7-dioic acid hydratase (catechol pathway) [Stigmatella erecta]